MNSGITQAISFDRLRLIAKCALALEANDLASEAENLRRRSAEGLFYVACVGQFKRGKSTLINALVGTSAVPTGVLPVTSAVTVIRHGSCLSAAVRLKNGETHEIGPERIVDYVSEECNPENKKGVDAVEIMVNHPILAQGLCLVDTPGLGSVFLGNTAVTKDFVPHIDAAIIVLGADPPISGDEAELVAEIAKQTSELIVVLNKADRVAGTDLDTAKKFTRDVLERRLGRTLPPIYSVSATERIAGLADSRDWPQFERHLMGLTVGSRSALIAAALKRGIERLDRRLTKEIDLQILALTEPLSATEAKLAVLNKQITALERSIADLSYLVQAEQDELSRAFANSVLQMVDRLLPQASAPIQDSIRRAITRFGLRKSAIHQAQKLSEQLMEAEFPVLLNAAEELYRKGMERFTQLAQSFVEKISSVDIAPGAFGIDDSPALDRSFQVASRFYYHEQQTLAPTSAWGQVTDLILPFRIVKDRIERDVEKFLNELFETNGTLIRNDLDAMVMESRRRLESELREFLQRTRISAEQRFSRTRATLAAGEDAVRGELARLNGVRAQVEASQH